MTLRLRRLALLLPVCLVVLAALAGCGDSSFRFVDADGDMVCDTPTDPAKLQNPDTLIFAYTPLEDPAGYKELWAGFCEHLATVTGKKVEFFTVNSNAAQLAALRSGRLHVTGMNTGSVPVAVNQAGFVPVCMMAGADGTWGYEMEVIVPAASTIQTCDELRGKTVGFTSETSNSGFKAPSVLLKKEFNIDVAGDVKAVFTGKHEQSILGIARGGDDYDAAAVANSVLRRMVGSGEVKAEDYRTIFKSATFPTTAYGMRHDLTPDLQEKIRQAFISYEWDAKLTAEFSKNGWSMFIPITYQQHWALVRDIDKALGKDYSLE